MYSSDRWIKYIQNPPASNVHDIPVYKQMNQKSTRLHFKIAIVKLCLDHSICNAHFDHSVLV